MIVFLRSSFCVFPLTSKALSERNRLVKVANVQNNKILLRLVFTQTLD